MSRLELAIRAAAPRALAALVRRYGVFDQCEDAVQEALLEAFVQWRANGVPEQPIGWLISVASRRMMDGWRRDNARRQRELNDYLRAPDDLYDPDDYREDADDTVRLLVLCCHPELTPASQIALTLRSVGGLTTAEVAAALLVSETTVAQRISRAKRQLKDARFELPTAEEYDVRMRAVLQVLYLIFNEGHTASAGDSLQRVDLAEEALRITRLLCQATGEAGEVAGLLALMILIHARRDARTGPGGNLIPADRQDRSRWYADEIAQGIRIVEETLRTGPLGPYQLEAAIAAVHSEADSVETTDWEQIAGLYRILEKIDPSPMVTLGSAVAVAMTEGPDAGIAVVEGLADDRHLGNHHRRLSVLAHLHELAGRPDLARTNYLAALERTRNTAEQNYLRDRIAHLI
ncbi:RNA polymerase sigma factor (sigma-70 family) [Kribbella sp. VKM Ac-2571]|uniref:RNA polymerase sigma factor n=1 Tax=Kribbella sp. VKM Ac-2571 TaxID=2512222 RepID=UPI00105C73E4|nr:sigma-70 family RNA polymerase sigma factor [Kribbella sp. VKM Ac-2571]TDO60994.1 RNA polymerase sigma factor (sigma-70 family) [Kribbella sp. VKM Ac-2571]